MPRDYCCIQAAHPDASGDYDDHAVAQDLVVSIGGRQGPGHPHWYWLPCQGDAAVA